MQTKPVAYFALFVGCQWRLRCQHCGRERSIWEAGGIRYGGRGRKSVWLRCNVCGRRSNHLLYRAETA